MSRAVVDASAVLAFLLKEPGWAAAEPWLAGSQINAVNLAEAASRLLAQGAMTTAVRALVDGLHLQIVGLDTDLAYMTAELHRNTRSHGLSLADCGCLSLAMARRLPAVTADRAWANLGLDLEIVLIR